MNTGETIQVLPLAEAFIKLHQRIDAIEDSQQPPPADQQVLAYLARVDSALAGVREEILELKRIVHILTDFCSIVYAQQPWLVQRQEEITDFFKDYERDRKMHKEHE